MKKKHLIIYITITIVILFPLIVTFISNNTSKQQQDYYNKQSYVLVDTLLTSSIPQTEWSKLNCLERESFLEKLIMGIYVPQIKEAVDKYYKELRGIDFLQITDVKAVAPYEYEMKILISTYVGAHNPPYGVDIATIHFSRLRDGKVVNFEHNDE